MNTSEPMDTTVGPISVKTKPKSERKKSIRDKQLQEEIQQSIRLKDGKYVMVKSDKKSKCWEQFYLVFEITGQTRVAVEGYSVFKYCLVVFFHAGTTTRMNRHLKTCKSHSK